MQASTRQEFDAYLDVLEAASGDARVSSARKFEQEWPRSELLPHTLYIEAEAHRMLGESKQALSAAERAVKAAKDHIPALVLLAELVSNAATQADQLSTAERYAQQAFDLLQAFRAPPSTSLETWEAAHARMQSRIFAARGLIAYKKGEISKAIQEFEAAEARTPIPDAAVLYRLGKLYRETGRVPEAVQMMKRVESMHEPVLRGLAVKELRELQ